MSNNLPYSYDQILAIIDLSIGLEMKTRLDPDALHIRRLGINQVSKIMGMSHHDRILLMKEVIEFL